MTAAIVIAGVYLIQLWLKAGLALSVRAREPVAAPADLRRLTVIQPIVSGDASLAAVLEKNLRELRGATTIWIIDRNDDAACRLCRSLEQQHPANEILILETDEPAVSINPKMWKQLAALPHVQTELVAVIDDDTWTPRRSVDCLVSTLDAGADLATGLPSYVAAPGHWSRLVAEFVNSSAILTYLSAAACVKPISINGMCYAMRTRFVRDHGIFDACVGAMTDDLAVAKAVARHGRIVQTSQPQHISTSVTTFSHYRRLMHRWFVFTRLLFQNEPGPTRIALLLAYGLHPALLFTLFLLAPAHPWPLVTVLVARALTLALLNRRLVGAWRHAPGTSVISEVFQPCFFVGAFFHPVIWWRRRRIRVHAINHFEYLPL